MCKNQKFFIHLSVNSLLSDYTVLNTHVATKNYGRNFETTVFSSHLAFHLDVMQTFVVDLDHVTKKAYSTYPPSH